MPKIGVRALKHDASEVIRAVREEQAQYIVTYRGRPVAIIAPVRPETMARAEEELMSVDDVHDAYWRELDDLAARIDAAWRTDKSGVELVDEQRR